MKHDWFTFYDTKQYIKRVYERGTNLNSGNNYFWKAKALIPIPENSRNPGEVATLLTSRVST